MDSETSTVLVENPLEVSAEREQRIRERAYHLWEQDGCPSGQDAEFWERASELDAMEASRGAAQRRVESGEVVDEAALEANLGEFPDRSADQGEHLATPMTRGQLHADRDRS